jgi:hypothetical protein
MKGINIGWTREKKITKEGRDKNIEVTELEDRNDLMSFVGVHLMASSHAVCHIKK